MQWVSNDTVYGPGGITLAAHMKIFNTSPTDDVLVRVAKLQNELPTDWGSPLCLDVCYLPDIDTAIVPIAAGDTMDFYYYFYSTPGSATGYTRIGLRNENDNSNSFTRQVWGVAEGAVGLDQLDGTLPSFLYPNPAQEWVQWTGSVAGDELVVVDMRGCELLRATHGETVDVGPLAPGVYLARHMRHGLALTTQRLAVER